MGEGLKGVAYKFELHAAYMPMVIISRPQKGGLFCHLLLRLPRRFQKFN